MLSALYLFFKKKLLIFEPFLLLKYHLGPNCRVERHFIARIKDGHYQIAPPLPTSREAVWIHKDDERIKDTNLNYESWFQRMVNLLKHRPTILMRYNTCEYGCGRIREYKIAEVTNFYFLLQGEIDFDCTALSIPKHEIWIAKDDPRLYKQDKNVSIQYDMAHEPTENKPAISKTTGS